MTSGLELITSPATGRSPLHSKSHIRRLCFVNLLRDADTINLIREIEATWPDINIVHSKTGLEYMDDPDVVFFFKDFQGDLFYQITAENDDPNKIGTRVIGPPYVKSRLIQNQILFSPKLRRPLFSIHMASVIVVLSRDLHKDKKTMARWIQYMGGRVKKDLNGGVRPAGMNKITVFVGRELSKDQRAASLLQYPTLKPDWVDYCWSQRTDPYLNILAKDILEKYTIGVFEGLNIYFLGFDSTDKADMGNNVEEHGGHVVTNLSEASHIVCNPQAVSELSSLVLHDYQIAVTDHWLWQSLNSSRCLTEDDYFLREYPNLCKSGPYGRVKSTASLADCERSKSSDDFYNMSSDDVETYASPVVKTPNTPATPKSPTGLDKRQQVIMEILETESNYVQALELMINFQDWISSEWIKKEGNFPLSASDLQLIFGKLTPIFKVHRSILSKLQRHVESWEKKTHDTPISSGKAYNEKPMEIADIWISEKNNLLMVYPPYLNTQESAKKAFEAADQKCAKFHTFVRSKESNPDFKRQRLTDLLARPVQRLPSVTLLLKELQKKQVKNDQIKKLGDAVVAVQDVLQHANTVRFKTDVKIAHLTRFTDMDKVPDHLVCSRRQFVEETDAVSVIGTGDFQRWPKLHVRILLFNDVLVVCKKRDQNTLPSPSAMPSTPTGTISRLRKQTSLSALKKTYKKPLKYIKHIPIQYIRDVRNISDMNDYDGKVPFLSGSLSNPLTVVTIREDTSADLIWIIHPFDRITADKLFSWVQQHIQMEFNRNIRTGGLYPLTELLNIPELEDILRKYMKRNMQYSANSTLNITVARGQSLLRRAISSASMSVTNRFSRGAPSRSNLREIMECTPTRECEELRGAPPTPLYEVNPRIDTRSSPDLLDRTECITPKRGLRGLKSRLSTLNLSETFFRKPSFRQRPLSPSFEENKEN